MSPYANSAHLEKFRAKDVDPAGNACAPAGHPATQPRAGSHFCGRAERLCRSIAHKNRLVKQVGDFPGFFSDFFLDTDENSSKIQKVKSILCFIVCKAKIVMLKLQTAFYSPGKAREAEE